MPYKHGRRKKHRTHKEPAPGTEAKVPQSLVLRRGKVGIAVKDLVHDVRRMMMPHTATKLHEQENNSLKDFISVASPLGVTHLVMLSQTEKGPILRVARIPRGPTLTFRVTAYSLAAAVRSSQRRPVDIAAAFEHPPLVVLHNFTSAASSAAAPAPAPGVGVSLPDALKMCMVTFQNMFPPINPATVKLTDCRRVVLFHYHKGTGEVELRHYVIRAMPVGITRAVKKMAQARTPDLGGLQDVSEFVLSNGRAGAGAASDSEFEDDAGHVTLPQDYAGVGNTRAAQSAVRLSEIGPRMTLKLLKIEQDVCKGEVLYHGYVRRSAADAAALRAAAKAREQLKAQRRAEQEANVARKAAEKAAKAEARAARRELKQQAAVTAAADGTLGDGEESSEDDEEADGDEEADDEEAEEDGGEEEAGEGVDGSGDGAEAGGGDEDEDRESDAGIDDDEEGEADDEDDLEGEEGEGGGPSEAVGSSAAAASAPRPVVAPAALEAGRGGALRGQAAPAGPPLSTLPQRSSASAAARGGGSAPSGAAVPPIVSPKTRGGKLLRAQQQAAAAAGSAVKPSSSDGGAASGAKRKRAPPQS